MKKVPPPPLNLLLQLENPIERSLSRRRTDSQGHKCQLGLSHQIHGLRSRSNGNTNNHLDLRSSPLRSPNVAQAFDHKP
ncbi:hypothetical protein PanWU01x14_333840 [Parasponia andersonii]|uniref:Uncharacterized protein n=1 Tax=Parasponia andersonii TaxID=3476 RepID=A0A2P5AGR3_PARAD|nr:hypothetical protein PanWU01x14_333840 [Parasponia andersonii]